MANSIFLLYPLRLLLVFPCVGLLIFFGLKKKTIPLYNKIFNTVFRGFVCLVVILSLSGAGVERKAENTATVFLLDDSDSGGDREGAKAFAQASLAYMGKKDGAGAVVFGENAIIDSLPEIGVVPNIFSGDPYVNPGYTNIAGGLNMAKSLLPADAKKRVVLLSDGLENVGSALDSVKLLGQEGIVLDVYYSGGTVSQEVQLSRLNVPSHIKANVAYTIETEIYSISSGSAELLIYRDNQLIHSVGLALSPGENRYAVNDMARGGGRVNYRAEIRPAGDTFAQNNRLHATSYVDDLPQVLLVEGDEKGELYNLLVSSGVHGDKTSPVAAPSTLEGLAFYDAVIVSDASIEDLPPGFDGLLESYVRDLGGGVMVSGGEYSFGPGGYKDTGLERLLPVNMDITDETKRPKLAMAVVLDRSGSMSYTQGRVSALSLAKESVIRSIESLNPEDILGVLTFDDGFEWVVALDKVGEDTSSIVNRVGGITDGGGTSILPALEEAVERLKDQEGDIKHIILLTDGYGEDTGYASVIKRILDNGITLSAIAVGGDSDTELLQLLAERGGGRYYYADAFTDLPKIFTKETFLAGKNYINNWEFTPSAGAASPMLTDIGGLPKLYGYVAASPKADGDVVLYTDKDDPLLASRQYGLGRSVAWTSDFSGRWASDFLKTEEGPRLFRNMLSWLLRRQVITDYTLEVSNNGNITTLTLTAPYSEKVEGVKGNLVGENQNKALDFQSSQPGVFTAELENMEEGVYTAALTINSEEGEEVITPSVTIPYSPEYDFRSRERGRLLMENMARASGGRMLSSPQEVFAPFEAQAAESFDLTGILLIVGLVAFVLDVALRKFPMIENMIKKGILFCVIKLGMMVKNNHKKNKKVKNKINIDEKLIKDDTRTPQGEIEEAGAAGVSQALLSGMKKRRR